MLLTTLFGPTLVSPLILYACIMLLVIAMIFLSAMVPFFLRHGFALNKEQVLLAKTKFHKRIAMRYRKTYIATQFCLYGLLTTAFLGAGETSCTPLAGRITSSIIQPLFCNSPMLAWGTEVAIIAFMVYAFTLMVRQLPKPTGKKSKR